jgi:HEPN domain-containing protein
MVSGMGSGPRDEPEFDRWHLQPDVLDAMRRLSRHYIPARYPDAHPSGPAAAHYAEADSAEAIGDAEVVLHAVDEAWRSLA